MSNRKLFLGIGLLLLTVLACSLFSKPPVEASPTETSQPEMYLLNDALTLAAQTIYAKTIAESDVATKTPLATSVQAFHTTMLPETIAGEHHVAMGETLSCIGRGYGVLPKAIADTNGIDLLAELQVGQVLLIPEVKWSNISAGPICPPQFPPPFFSVTATAVPQDSDQHLGDEKKDGEKKDDDKEDDEDQIVIQPPDVPNDPPEPEETEDPFPTGLPPGPVIVLPPIDLPPGPGDWQPTFSLP